MLKICSFVLAFFTVCNVSAKDDLCEVWHYQMDTTSNIQFAYERCREVYPNVGDVCRVEVIIVLGEIYMLKAQLDSAYLSFNRAIQEAKLLGNDRLLISASFRKAGLLLEDGKIEEGKKLLSSTRSLLDDYPKDEGWIGYYRRMAALADINADYSTAMAYTDSVLQKAIAFRDPIEIPDSYHNLGVYYLRMSNYEMAAENLLKSLQLKKRIEGSDMASTYYVLGSCYQRWGQYEVGKGYLVSGLEICLANGNSFLAVKIYNAVSRVNLQLGLEKEALEMADEALELASEIGVANLLAETQLEKVRIFRHQKQDAAKVRKMLDQSLVNAKKSTDQLLLFSIVKEATEFALEEKKMNDAYAYLIELDVLSGQQKMPKNRLSFYELQSQYYEVTDSSEQALRALKNYNNLKDSIENPEIYTRIADLEKKYNTKEKELSILKLNQENERERERTSQAQFRQKVFLGASIILGVLLIVGIALVRRLNSQRKKLEKARNELSDLNQVKTKLFSILAHDLKGMVVPFQRAGKIFNYHINKGNYERSKALADELENNAERLSSTLNNLLQWSLTQMNGYKNTPVSIQPMEDLQEIISLFESHAAMKNTTINLSGDWNGSIFLDKGAFQVVFRNLIGNAVKFTENGSIDLTVGRKNESLWIVVKDDGVGMDEDQLSRLFQINNFESSTGTSGEKGTGLGLDLVKRFVNLSGGEITVQSQKGKGTCFELFFPLKQSR